MGTWVNGFYSNCLHSTIETGLVFYFSTGSTKRPLDCLVSTERGRERPFVNFKNLATRAEEERTARTERRHHLLCKQTALEIQAQKKPDVQARCRKNWSGKSAPGIEPRISVSTGEHNNPTPPPLPWDWSSWTRVHLEIDLWCYKEIPC